MTYDRSWYDSHHSAFECFTYFKCLSQPKDVELRDCDWPISYFWTYWCASGGSDGRIISCKEETPPPTGSIAGLVWCDLDCDGQQDVELEITLGDPVFTGATSYESVTCTRYNVASYGDWKSTGAAVIDLVVGAQAGHAGNAPDNTIVELDQGGSWSRSFSLDAGGSYLLSLDAYRNLGAGDAGNRFEIRINGQMVESVLVTQDGRIELEVELPAGLNRIDLVSTSLAGGRGAGIDNVNFQPLIQNATRSEPVKSGVLIKLLDAQGEPVLGADGQPITTVTDASGSYRFDGLPVGEYRIVGVAPDGTEFTLQDQGSDDSRDSDVDSAGRSGLICVTAKDTAQVDLGLCKLPPPNDPPNALDAAAMGCADTLILVDFSDNYSDTDSAGVAVTMIDGQAIVAGGPAVTLSDGVSVLLTAEDSFIFDGTDAYAALDIGQSHTASYTVTVADTEGATASASLEVTYCGDANSLESWVAALPETVTFQVRATDLVRPVEDAAYDVRILQGDGNARLDGLYLDQAYCVSRHEPITGAEDIDLAPVVTGRLVLSSDPQVADVFALNGASVFNGQSAAENLDLVSWILNQQFETRGTSGWVVQRAIWELTDSQDMGFLDAIDPGFGTDTEVQSLLAQAAAHEGYMPGTGDLVAVLIDPDPSDPQNLQPFIAALEFETYDCLC